MIVTLIGGIGLFLLGMLLMTDGLKAVAGDALRRILRRFVSGPVTAMTSGAVSTALVQSSSAITLTTIGFVSAGLITFPQAVGVIFGANLGTTSTAWIVSLLGFKLDISLITLPMIAAGAMMRLLGRKWISPAGLAVAGFGLVFVGIDSLQAGMAGLAERIDLTGYTDDSLPTRLLLILIGAAMTVIMQSSSAAVATTLAALHGGAIGLEQAGALVIGQNIGTTVKVLLVSIGASSAVKRTAAAHILFNLVTGLVALGLLSPFVWLVTEFGHLLEEKPGVLTLAAFHTAFNLLGIALFLPWLEGFSRLVARMIPERVSRLTRQLDESVLQVPDAAVEAARSTVMEIAAVVTKAAATRLDPNASKPLDISGDLDEAEHALEEVTRFLGRVRGDDVGGEQSRRTYEVHLSTLHAVDHLLRLVAALRQVPQRSLLHEPSELRPLVEEVGRLLVLLRSWIADADQEDAAGPAETISRGIADRRRAMRPMILQRTASGELTPAQALEQLESLQWIDKIAYHLWRSTYHLDRALAAARGAPRSGALVIEPSTQ